MENQTYSRKIKADYIIQLSLKKKSWQSLISVATKKHNQREKSDLKHQKRQITCMENENSNKKRKKKIKRGTNNRSRINEQQQVENMLQGDKMTKFSNIVYQHEADTTMLKFNGKKSSYSNRSWLSNSSCKNLRSTWFTCSLLVTIFIAILLQPANSWRIFEPGTEARHALGSSSIISSNNNNNLFTSLPINPAPNQNQNQQLLLTPLSMQPQPLHQHQAAVSAQSATESVSNQNTRQQTSKEPDSASLSSRSSDSSPNKNQHQESSKQDGSGSSHAGSSIPALVGKILDATSESLINNRNNSFGFPSTSSILSEKLVNTSSQLLKPRKSTDRDQFSSSKHINSVEQQIINQHANMLASHQRLMPTKQRDQKITSLLSSSSSSSFDSRNSPLNSILDTFKSSISSRSSIVKAISDNKLARTLSEVGKSISGNKYVAGAAAASAIAALGLAVSKFLSPYATPYSKIGAGMIGDPMLSSESNMRPSYLISTTDSRNQFYQNPADSMYPAASQSSGSIRSQSQQSLYPMPSGQAEYNSYSNPTSGLSNDVGSQYQAAIYQAANAFQPSAFSPQQAAAAASSSGYLDSNFNSLAGNGNSNNNNRVFFTYTKGTSIPGVQSENLNNNNEQQQQQQQQHSSGRYLTSGQIQNGNEYQSNGNENDIPSSQQHTTSTPFELNSSSSFDNPISVYAQQPQQEAQEKFATTRDRQHYSSASPSAGQNMFISAAGAGNGMATSAILSSASSSSLSASSSPSLSSSQSTGFTSRRSGPVSLKMNDAIKERLNNLQKINNKTPQYWMTRQPTTVVELSDSDFKELTSIGNNFKYPYSMTSSSSSSKFVPMIAAASDATNSVAEQHVTAVPIKLSRLESNSGDQQQQQQVYSSTIGNNHASSTNKQPKRQQQQQQVSYTIIRPKTGNTSSKLEAITPEATPQSAATTSDGGLQRSFTSKAAGASWSTVTSKQIASNNHDSDNNDNQQISEQVVTDNNQAAVSSEGGSQQQQQQQQPAVAEQTLLHRVSRTPNQSSVKQQTSGNINSSENSKLTTTGGTDYELTAASENLSNKLLPPTSSNGLKSNNNHNIGLPYLESSNSLNFSGNKSARKQGATNRQQQHVAHDDHHHHHHRQVADATTTTTTNVEDNTTTNDDELKATANLIQLSADGNSEGDLNSAKESNLLNQNNNANNNVKLIEANTSNVSERQVEISADKLADTGLVIMLPTTRNSHTSDTTERRATSMKSTGDSATTTTATGEFKPRHNNNKLHSQTENNLNDEHQREKLLEDDDKRDASMATQLSSSSLTSSDINNEEMSPDTPFGGFFGSAGYSLGGQR